MGALHDGHLALLRAARDRCDTVVMSLFVNPAQFGEPADLDGYPRDETHDLDLAHENGVTVVFAPPAGEMYTPGYQTWVDVTELGAILEGEHRPTHFRGVATVCLKLFNIVRPNIAFYGQKDAQQVDILRRMITDLNLELELVVVPTVRDPDGLALSSRNARLSAADRARALALPRALATRDPETARAILEAAGLEVDYVAVAPFEPPVLAAAVHVGGTRLIDNVTLEEES
jgi:pantoate--beta-alanine ligase